MAFYIYILQCADHTYYVGCTSNIEKRLHQHNHTKKGARYTKMRRPLILKYQETFTTLLAARRREREIKKWKKEKKEMLFLTS